MSYKVVKDLSNNVICFGPDDGSYNPVVQEGQVLVLVTEKEAEAIMKDFAAKAQTQLKAQETARKNAIKKLTELGLTAAEIAAL